jgi:hypothetical protein
MLWALNVVMGYNKSDIGAFVHRKEQGMWKSWREKIEN